MATRTLELAVPGAWDAPAFYAAASPDDVSVALDAAARLIPWATKLVHAHQDEQEDARRQGVNEAVEAALHHLEQKTGERINQESHELRMSMYDVKTKLEDANAALAQTKQALAISESRAADAEARGRASALLQCDARLQTEIEKAERRHASLDDELRKRADDAYKERDEMRVKCNEMAQSYKTLEQKNRYLETPAGKGESGEAVVSQITDAIGYRVYDTSKFKDKDKYGDLLCCQCNDEYDSEGPPPAAQGVVRLAIEIKNRDQIRTSDVVAFETKVRNGVAAGLFEGGLFISLRHTIPGINSCAKQKLLDDGYGRPTVPMAYLSAARGAPKHVPVLAEHVEIMLQAHMHLCEQITDVRFALGGEHMSDHDIQRVQAHFAELSSFATEMFAQFGKHQEILDNARLSLNSMKRMSLVMYRAARRMNTSVPWLKRPMAHLPFEKGLDHAVRLAAEERLIWNNVTSKDSVFSHLGRECAQSVIHEEMRRLGKEAEDAKEFEDAEKARRDKRPREEEPVS